MSILADKRTRVGVQGITGREGAFHAARCKEYGTTVVGGVTPGKGGTTHDGFPVWNTVVEAAAQEGANCPGGITPGQAKVGIMPGHIHREGPVGVVSRSGTLTYEVVHKLTGRAIGQSTCVGIGGAPVAGTSFVDALRLFNDDPETRAVMLIGEIGGTAGEEAAAVVKAHMQN